MFLLDTYVWDIHMYTTERHWEEELDNEEKKKP
jgi:hypothetical protein